MKPHKDSVCILRAKPGNDMVYLLLKQRCLSHCITHPNQTKFSQCYYVAIKWGLNGSDTWISLPALVNILLTWYLMIYGYKISTAGFYFSWCKWVPVSLQVIMYNWAVHTSARIQLFNRLSSHNLLSLPLLVFLTLFSVHTNTFHFFSKECSWQRYLSAVTKYK